jgi:hypothetical protein
MSEPEIEYRDRPVLTLGFTTGEEIAFDLDVQPPLCAVHRNEIPEEMERLTMNLQHDLVGEREVEICYGCLSEHAPKMLEVLLAS